MRIDKFLIGLVVFSLFIVVGVGIWSSMVADYELDINASDKFGDVYETADEMFDLGVDTKDDVIKGDLAGGDESWESMTKGSYKGLRRTVTQSPTLVGEIISAILRELGVGDDEEAVAQFHLAAMIILGISLTFALIYLVFRFMNR